MWINNYNLNKEIRPDLMKRRHSRGSYIVAFSPFVQARVNNKRVANCIVALSASMKAYMKLAS